MIESRWIRSCCSKLNFGWASIILLAFLCKKFAFWKRHGSQIRCWYEIETVLIFLRTMFLRLPYEDPFQFTDTVKLQEFELSNDKHLKKWHFFGSIATVLISLGIPHIMWLCFIKLLMPSKPTRAIIDMNTYVQPNWLYALGSHCLEEIRQYLQIWKQQK